MYGSVLTTPTSYAEAKAMLPLLDWATLETERITGTDPLESLIGSQTAWFGEYPMCSYGIVEPEDGQPARAWMMTTKFVAEQRLGRHLLKTMRVFLGEAVARYGRVEGYALMTGHAPRMLHFLGATFMVAHPKLVCWELHENDRLRRAG